MEYNIMNEVVEINVLENYHLWLKFKDGEEKTINFRKFIGKGFTKELLDHDKFKKVFIEPGAAWLGKTVLIFVPISRDSPKPKTKS